MRTRRPGLGAWRPLAEQRDAAENESGGLRGSGGAATERLLGAQWPEKRRGRCPRWSATAQGLMLECGPSGTQEFAACRAPAEGRAAGLAARRCYRSRR
ncbi:hypothetical protein NDU88_002192 [Pleurodeles waltl]|uniref:Uncharacterized protein n=1 Tax=Pleurodeles waltl TaxID=8319 RepID=A0AAV7T1E2_PLEWA|nr:hypothetical protein NDU88_002192 [Pleurodeles waltl]